MSSTNTLVIEIKYGGLGDHLFYSHIPRIAKEHGSFKRVEISNSSEYRDQDYKELVWARNPYIDGFSDARGISIEFGHVDAGYNLLDTVMLGFGLDDGKRYHEPELYAQPLLRDDLAGRSIYDPNFISFVGS